MTLSNFSRIITFSSSLLFSIASWANDKPNELPFLVSMGDNFESSLPLQFTVHGGKGGEKSPLEFKFYSIDGVDTEKLYELCPIGFYIDVNTQLIGIKPSSNSSIKCYHKEGVNPKVIEYSSTKMPFTNRLILSSCSFRAGYSFKPLASDCGVEAVIKKVSIAVESSALKEEAFETKISKHNFIKFMNQSMIETLTRRLNSDFTKSEVAEANEKSWRGIGG
ncbi:hypothetical protein QTV49_004670 [Vibrio vulnificus]|nr:hypothetical protein [Vibrio vulnificus]